MKGFTQFKLLSGFTLIMLLFTLGLSALSRLRLSMVQIPADGRFLSK